MTENIYVDYQDAKLSFPRDIPLRVWKLVDAMNKLTAGKTEEEAAKNWEPLIEQSNKLIDLYIKWNPSLEELIEDMDQTSAYEVFGVWAKKVRENQSAS